MVIMLNYLRLGNESNWIIQVIIISNNYLLPLLMYWFPLSVRYSNRLSKKYINI